MTDPTAAPPPDSHPGAAGGALGRRLLALTALALLAALLWAGWSEARALDAFYRGEERLPLWDMAGHGWGGVELLGALHRGEPLGFLDRLNRQDKWPFGYSLFLLPFLAAGGVGFAAATLLSTVLFALVPALLLWAAREVERGAAGLAGGLLAGLLFLLAPLHRVFAILIMRETAGIAFTALALALYLRARRAGTAWSYRLAGLAALALFFVKVNYAAVFLLAVALVELLDLPPGERRALLARGRRLLWPWPGATLGRTLLAVALDLLLVSAVAGANFGVGLYALLVISTATLALRWRKERAALAARWRALPKAARQLAATFVLPLWIWSLSPDPIHPKTIVGFLKNRETGPPLLSADSLLYYPRAFLGQYATSPRLGLAVLLLALAGAAIAWRSGAKWRGEGKGWRLLAALALLGLLLATAHPYKEPRFLATTAPFLVLLAALAAARLAFRLGGLAPAGSPLGLAAGAVLTAGAVAGLAAARTPEPVRTERLAADYRLYSSAPAYRRPLDLVGRWALGGPRERAAAGRRRIAFVGSSNELSDSLFRWSLAQEGGFAGPEVVDPLPRFRADLPADRVAAKVGEWLEEERPDRLIALRPLPGAAAHANGDFAAYNAWQVAAVAALEAHPGWTAIRRRELPRVEIEALYFEPRPAPPPPAGGGR